MIDNFEIDAVPRLGLNLGTDAQSFARAKLFHLSSEAGALVFPDGTVGVWSVEGFVERGGSMFLYGPDFKGVELLPLLGDGIAMEKRVDAVRQTISAILAAGEEAVVPSSVPAGVVIGEGGATLFLPGKAVARALDFRGPGFRLMAFLRWTAPNLASTEALAFSCACLLGQALSGSAPFAGNDEEALCGDIREGMFTSAALGMPGLRPALAREIDAALSRACAKTARETADGSSTASLRNLLEASRPEGEDFPSPLFSTLSDVELERTIRERDWQVRSRQAAARTRRFARKNAFAASLILAVLVVGALALRGWLVDAKKRPTTAGMSPREVVATYYRAFDAFNFELMAACVTDGAGKQDIESATTLFVMGRARMAYEQKETLVSAETWIASGKPPFDGIVFGTAGLVIEEAEGGLAEGKARYLARYERWRPGTSLPQEGKSSVPAPEMERLLDSIDLVLRKNAWRIASIRREIEPR